ncbi:MAG: serine hydrolase domain-containing protein [Candidatus Saccharicenans sp.]
MNLFPFKKSTSVRAGGLLLLIFFNWLLVVSCQTPESLTASRIKALEKGLLRAVYLKGQRPEKLRLIDRMDFYKVPGVSLAVMDKYQIEWLKTYGYKEIIHYKKLTPETAFQTGELSQPVAATSVMRLIENKKLRLDDDVGPTYQEVAFAGRKIKPREKFSMTIASLLSHQAGFYPWISPGYPLRTAIPDLAQVLRGESPATNFFSFRGFDQEGGVRFSDFNYVLLQLYVESKIGQKLEEITRTEILNPLGLKNTFYGLPANQEIALGHDRQGPEIEGGFYQYPEAAARGLWSNPAEYLKFMVNLLDSARTGKPGLISADLARKMLSPQAPGIGFGFRLEGEREHFKIYMKGKTTGYRAAILIYPALGQGVVIMTNSDNGWILIDEILRGLSAIYDWPDFKPEEKPLYRLDPSIYQQYCGRYEVNENYFLDVSNEDYYLIVHPTGQSPTKFYVETQTIFFSVDPFIRIKFNLDEQGKVTGLVLWQEDYEIRAKKIS